MPAAESPAAESPAPASPATKKAADSPLKTAVLLAICGVALVVAGYYIKQQLFPADPWRGEIKDDPRETNVRNASAEDLLDLPLTDSAGQSVSLRDRLGKKHLVIVFTRGSLSSVSRGNKGPTPENFPHVCAYCSSQASGIFNRLADFTAADAEVMIVFPVSQPSESKDATELLQAAGVSEPAPLPILFDLNLKAVDKLDLRAHLARPASFIVDKTGELRFAYVAKEGNADRPSAAELLRHLGIINEQQSPQAQPASNEATGPKS